MPLRVLISLVPLTVALTLTGCTKPPSMPRLASHDPSPMERVVLHERLTAEDVRGLFRAVNRDGKLDALKPYLEAPSDATLGELGELTTRYLYDDAQSAVGILALARKRSDDRSFTRFAQTVAREAANAEFPSIRDAIWYLASLDVFPSLVKRDLPLLEPPMLRIARAAWAAGRDDYRDSREHAEGEALSMDALVSDADRFLGDGARRVTLETFLRRIGNLDFASAALKAFHGVRNDKHLERLEGVEREAKAMEPFEGLGHGLRRLVTSGNELEKLLTLAKTLDGPSAGLFTEAQRKIVSDEVAHQLTILLRPNIAGGITGLVREMTAKLPFKSYLERFIAIRRGIEEVTGPARPDSASDYLVYNLPIFLNTYALEKWLSAMGALPANRALWERISRSGGFTDAAWDTEVELPTLDVDIIKQEGTNFVVDGTFKADLESIELDSFVTLLADGIRGEGLGDFRYAFVPQQPRKPLREAFADAVRACDNVRNFTDSSAYVRLLIFRLTRREQGSRIVFSDFETPNMMDSLSHLLTLVGRGEWPKLKGLLFDDVKVGRLDGQTRRILLSLFDDRDMKRRVGAILDNVQSIYELDRDVRGLPSPFDMYLRLVEALPRPDKHAATMLLSYASDSGLLARDRDRRPAYPGFWILASGGRPLARITYALSTVDILDRARLIGVGTDLLSGAGLTEHLDVLAALAHDRGPGVAAALRRVLEGDDTLSLPDFSDDERAWLRRFTRDGDLARLMAFFKAHGSRADVAALTSQLEELSRSGYLRDALTLLTQVRNERVVALARTALAWDESGELRQLLGAIRLLTRP